MLVSRAATIYQKSKVTKPATFTTDCVQLNLNSRFWKKRKKRKKKNKMKDGKETQVGLVRGSSFCSTSICVLMLIKQEKG